MSEVAIVVSNDNKGVHPFVTIDAIKKAGFKNVFVQLYEPDKEFEVPEIETIKRINEEGLHIIFAHLGYKGINNIWLDNEEGERFVDRYINDLKICKENKIDMVVMHLQSKFVSPNANEIGLNRFKRILNEAKKMNIKIAFENTRIADYVSYMIDNIKDDYVGICVDIGHLHCNSKDSVDIRLWKNRIFATHLHDNNGEDDEHKIPFDGNIDWYKYLKDLKEANYDSYITFEQCTKKYEGIDIYEFYKRSYEAAIKIKDYYDSL